MPQTRRREQAPVERSSSVGALFVRQADRNGDREAYRYPEGGKWVSLSWKQTGDIVFELAAALLATGVQLEDRVGIAADCRIEWLLADHAVMCAGGATTTVYPSTQHADVAYILSDSECIVVFAEDAGQVEKIIAHLQDLPRLARIVIMNGEHEHGLVVSWADFLAAGKAHLQANPDVVTKAIAGTGPDTLATLVYTSGTTGRPKGVCLVHDNWLYLGEAVVEIDILDVDDVQYLWLPMSHVFGKCLIAIQLRIGFATAVDGRIDKIVEGLEAVKPTFMAGAPRIFEKVRARVKMGAAHGVKAKIFDWAFAVGAKAVPVRLAGKQPTGLLKIQNAVATKLVFSKLTERMGGRIRFFISGSAALSQEVQLWFYAAGLTILEGYGLTETSAAAFVNLPQAPVFGTVGPPLPDTTVKLADDGEILIKGRGVMRGYHNLPAETAEALDADGFLHTGDIGELHDGRLRITDRKKDLIKTSGGKYVAPQKVEGALKAACPYLSQVLVHGEGRKYVTALFELDTDAIGEWATDNGMADRDYAGLAGSAEVKALISGYVDDANTHLERWETVKQFGILTSELSVANGDITPSLKLRRKAVEKRFSAELDSLYPQD
ncbi:MAG: AMP-dependent synthetase/ligase [Propionibacteriaceae bacterium]